jgi:glucokinase
MYPYIVADIGGTNARFALVMGKSQGNFLIDHIHVLKAQEYPSCSAALRTYLEKIDGIKPQSACLAIAGPVVGDTVRMTNLSWEFSCAAMAKEFGFHHFVAMNDFAAVSAACSQLTDDHLITIKKGVEERNATKAVFGPGTGLGVAGLVNHYGQWVPVPCEGGHVNIAPATPFEADVIKAAMAALGHVSAELFISGQGFVNLYKAICAVRGEQPKDLSPADITEGALANTDESLSTTLETFCSLIGSFAGNLALTYGAKGGIYMAGGILPRFSDYLLSSTFTERFSNKGVMSHYLDSIPAKLIVHPETAFVGAAAWLEQQVARGG